MSAKFVRHQALIVEPYEVNGIHVHVEMDGFDNHRLVVKLGSGMPACSSWTRPRGIALVTVLIAGKLRTFVTGGRYWARTLAPAFELIGPS